MQPMFQLAISDMPSMMYQGRQAKQIYVNILFLADFPKKL